MSNERQPQVQIDAEPKLTPLEAATKFAEICYTLDSRIFDGEKRRLNWTELNEHIYGDELTDQLKKLIQNYYQGTDMGRDNVLTNIGECGYYEYERSFTSLANVLGMNPGKPKTGVFDKDGAKTYERNVLLSRDARTDPLEFLEDKAKNAINFLIHIKQFENKFDSLYFLPSESDTKIQETQVKSARTEIGKAIRIASEFIESAEKTTLLAGKAKQIITVFTPEEKLT